MLVACAHEPPASTETTARLPTTPSATASASAPARPTALDVASATDAIASVRLGLKRCYNAALKSDPKLRAAVQLEIRVAPDGSVADVTSRATPPIPPELEQCFVAVVKSVVFDAPGGAGATLQVPINLVPPQEP